MKNKDLAEKESITKKQFLEGMTYLKAYYLNFKLDLDNKIVLSVWYDTLKEVSAKEFSIMINHYAKRNKFPPQSPADLISVTSGEPLWIFDEIYTDKKGLPKFDAINQVKYSYNELPKQNLIGEREHE